MYAWTGLISQAGITLGLASVVAAGVPDLGQPDTDAARRADRRSTSWSASALPLRPARAAASSTRRAAAADRRLQSRAVPPQLRRAGPDRRDAGDRRRRHRARCADARTRRRLDCARRRHRRPRVVDALGQGGGAARAARRTASPAVARGARVRRATTAGSRTRACGRSATWWTSARSSARGLGGLSGGQRAVCGGDRPGAARADTPVFIQDYHLALVAPRLRAAAGGADGAVLAHSVAVPRPPPHLPMAPGAPGWAARQRSARVPAGARSPQFPAGRRGGARARNRSRMATRIRFRRAHHAPSSRCRSASTTTASRAWPHDPALADEQARLRRRFRPACAD